MDKTQLYHALSGTFGLLALVFGGVQLSSSLTLTAGLFVVAGLGMLLTSAAALVRPDLVSTDEPATWKIVLLGIGVVLFGAGVAVTLT
ncbi:hypothetical protein SAMN05216559_3273 [Halomicrobium zhouii]|uniref:Uncharacterized protein n=1 Tax=Halomicrobium zhouii TaxID=767519 RepID=A0A1I6LWA5_9EURY|nr:hypothetical protein [Halomicrobium zhouii]SFS07706.1 hypothetical protein SAMN05216559_3273 [Halomicrobium zhouii]